MKTLIIAATAGVVSLGLWSAADHAPADLDPTISHSVPSGPGVRSYSISNIVANTACLAERGDKLSNRSQAFTADTDCDAVWPGLSQARTWTENGDGTIVVADARGEAIITVMEGDGLAYEALDPPDAMVTMISAD